MTLLSFSTPCAAVLCCGLASAAYPSHPHAVLCCACCALQVQHVAALQLQILTVCSFQAHAVLGCDVHDVHCWCSLSFFIPILCCAVLCVLCPAGAACCSSAAAASASCRCCCGQRVRWRAWRCSHSSHQIWLQQRSCSCRACLNKPPVHRLTSRHCLIKPSVYRLLPALTISRRPCLIKPPMYRLLQALTISFRASLLLAGRSWCWRSAARGCGRWGPMPWPC